MNIYVLVELRLGDGWKEEHVVLNIIIIWLCKLKSGEGNEKAYEKKI